MNINKNNSDFYNSVKTKPIGLTSSNKLKKSKGKIPLALLIASILAPVATSTALADGSFTPAGVSNGSNTVSGNVSSNGGTGTYILTRTAQTGYNPNSVNFTGGVDGIQAQNINQNSNTDPDSYAYDFTVVPPAGFVTNISVDQAAYATNGNSEHGEKTISWVGGGVATVSDDSTLFQPDRFNVFNEDLDFPPYSTFNAGCPRATNPSENQITGFATGDTLGSGDLFNTSAVDNVSAEWLITLPDDVTSLSLTNETLLNTQFPAYLADSDATNPNPCTDNFQNVQNGNSVQEWISFNVVFTPITPLAVDDSEINPIIGTPTAVDILANDGAPNGAPLDPATVQIVGTSAPGQDLVVAGEGTFSIDTATGVITFTPELSFTGNPTVISYTVDDDNGNTTPAVTVTIIYPEVPVVSNDSETNPTIGTPTVVDVLANDGDPSGAPLDPATVQIVGTSGPGQDLVVAGEGTFSVDSVTGVITFTPEPGFTGNPSVISYTVDDVNGNTSPIATVTIIYDQPPASIPPVVSNDSEVNPTIGTPTVVDVLANDGAPNGAPLDPVTVQILGTSAPGQDLVVAGEGTFSVNPATGVITFTPEPGFTGNPSVISYTVDDVNGNTSPAATVTIIYTQAPVVVSNDSETNPTIGTPTLVDVLANDGDPTGAPLDPATVQIVGTSAPGQDLVVAGEGTFSVDPGTGVITFTPEPSFTGNPSVISYTVDDVNGNTSPAATVTIIYTQAPVVSNDSETNPTVGTPTLVDVLANDGDPAGAPLDPATVQIVGTSAPGQDLVVAGEGTFSVDPGTGVITFTPEPGFTGNPSVISYTVDDVNGNTSPAATVTIIYTQAPIVVTNDSETNFIVGTPTVVDVLANDGDPAGAPLDPATVQIVGTSAPGQDLVIAGEGTFSVDPVTGAITFTPEPSFTGNPSVISYTVDDVNGNTSPAATVTIIYTLAPVVNVTNDSQTNPNPGTPTAVDVLANDGDPTGDPLDPATVQIVGTSAPGEDLVIDGEGTFSVDPATGVITFTPEPDFTGNPSVISYTVDDVNGNTSPAATVTVIYNLPSESIPTLSEWMLILLSMMLLLMGYRESTRKSKQKVGTEF